MIAGTCRIEALAGEVGDLILALGPNVLKHEAFLVHDHFKSKRRAVFW